MSKELMAISDSNVQAQVAVARTYPRDLAASIKKAKNAIALSKGLAESCIYAFERGGKMITGPSIRLAEIMLGSWGHMHFGAQVLGESKCGRFIEVQAIVIDRESNNVCAWPVNRSIMTSGKDKKGNPKPQTKFSTDMIGVTAAAACSIALRQAAFKVMGVEFANDLYEHAKKVALGKGVENEDIREKALGIFEKSGISRDRIFDYFNVNNKADFNKEDLTQENLELMVGIKTSIKEGHLKKENAFNHEFDAETGEVQDKAKELNDSLLGNGQESEAQQ